MDPLKLVWLLAVSFGGVCTILLINLLVKVWRPLRTKRYFESQGIGGPSYKMFHGNTGEIILMTQQARSTPMDPCHDIVPRVLPHIHAWTKSYGTTFLYWFGPIPRIVISDPVLVKEILSNKFGQFPKPAPTYQLRELMGDGLAISNAEKWARQRRLIAPAFHVESLKGMVPVAVDSTCNLLNKWKEAVASGSQEIEVFHEFRCLTADIIARMAFGSSYVEGKHIFDMRAEQAIRASTSLQKFSIPAYRFLPTRDNLKGRKLDRHIQTSFRRLILQRKNDVKTGKTNDYGTDLLGLLMTADNKSMPLQDIIDECKTFYFAGHESPWFIAIHNSGERMRTEFKPLRFAEGVSKAAGHPMAFMPFGLGPRICVGQNFALIESKVVLAMILQRFSFALSPAYAHAPRPAATLHPQHGARIILSGIRTPLTHLPGQLLANHGI